MSIETTRITMERYAEALLAFGDFGRHLAEDVTMTFEGTDRVVKGRDAVRDTIVFFHQQAFRSAVELKTLVCGERLAAIEAAFVGEHIGDFEGVAPTHHRVNVPYQVTYDVDGDRIRALRLYFPFELLMRQLAGVANEVSVVG